VVLAARHGMTIPQLLVMSMLEGSDEITAGGQAGAADGAVRDSSPAGERVNWIARVANSTRELPLNSDAAGEHLRRERRVDPADQGPNIKGIGDREQSGVNRRSTRPASGSVNGPEIVARGPLTQRDRAQALPAHQPLHHAPSSPGERRGAAAHEAQAP